LYADCQFLALVPYRDAVIETNGTVPRATTNFYLQVFLTLSAAT